MAATTDQLKTGPSPSVLSPFVYPYPAPSLHQRRLSRSVRSLKPEPEGGVLRVGEPVVSIRLQCRQLSDQRREVSGYVPAHVLRILRSQLRTRGKIYVPTQMDGRVAVVEAYLGEAEHWTIGRDF